MLLPPPVEIVLFPLPAETMSLPEPLVIVSLPLPVVTELAPSFTMTRASLFDVPILIVSPPEPVVAPGKGEIAVGWLCVSTFIRICVRPGCRA